jgi:hypothetical protein
VSLQTYAHAPGTNSFYTVKVTDISLTLLYASVVPQTVTDPVFGAMWQKPLNKYNPSGVTALPDTVCELLSGIKACAFATAPACNEIIIAVITAKTLTFFLILKPLSLYNNLSGENY